MSLDESLRYGTQIEQILHGASSPTRSTTIWSRTGTAEVATDPMGLEVTDVFVTLKPRETSGQRGRRPRRSWSPRWREVTEDLPGMRAVYSQPIEMRINEMVAGIRADLGIKLFGARPGRARRTRRPRSSGSSRQIPGAADVTAEQITGLPVLRVVVDRQALSRYGVPARQVLDAVAAAGGMKVGEVLEPDRRFPLVVRLPLDRTATTRDALERILIPTATGQRLPLTRLARLEEVDGPSTIQREWGERRIIVQANVRGRDIGSFVEEAQATDRRARSSCRPATRSSGAASSRT